MRVLENGLFDTCQEAHEPSAVAHYYAPIHNAGDTQERLDESNVYYIHDWPPNSPDMNPIEHCWLRVPPTLLYGWGGHHGRAGAV